MNSMHQNTIDKKEISYVGAWPRIGAAIIDGIVTCPIGALIIYNFLTLKSFPIMLFLTVLTMLYKPLMEWRFGATVGKMALKIKVVNESHNYISLEQAFGRYIPWLINHILSLISYSYIFNTEGFMKMDDLLNMKAIAVNTPIDSINTVYFYVFIILVGSLVYDKKKQGLHDKIAKTMVIRVTKS